MKRILAAYLAAAISVLAMGASQAQPAANRVEPGKRPRSSMAPTIVLDAEGRLRHIEPIAHGAADGIRQAGRRRDESQDQEARQFSSHRCIKVRALMFNRHFQKIRN